MTEELEKKAVELMDYIASDLENVAKLPKQLTKKQAVFFIKKYGYDAAKKQFEKMDNFKPLLKKYTSAGLTARNWFESDEQKGYLKNTESRLKNYDKPPTNPLAEAFLKKFPIGSKIKSTYSGLDYVVESSEMIRCTTNDKVAVIANLNINNFQKA